MPGYRLFHVCLSIAVFATLSPLAAHAQNGKDVSQTAGSAARGVVIDAATRKPLPGVTVYVYTARPRTGTSAFCPSCYPDCGKTARTDAVGSFLVPSLSQNLFFRFLAVRPGYEPAFVEEADPTRSTSLQFALKARPQNAANARRTVRATLRDPLGQPAVGATVEFVGYRGADGRGGFGAFSGYDEIAIADEAGQFALRAADENVSLYTLVKARGLAPRILSGLRTGATAQTVTLGYGASVLGTVRTAAGKPVPNAVVEFVPTNRNVESFTGWQEIATHADGTFGLVNVPPDTDGYLCVLMESLHDGQAVVRQRVHTATEKGTVEGVVLTTTPGATLRGQIVLPNQAPVPPGTRVMLGRAETWDAQSAVADKEGRFAFAGVPPTDAAEISLRIQGYRYAKTTAGLSPGGYSVDVKEPGKQKTPIVITMIKE